MARSQQDIEKEIEENRQRIAVLEDELERKETVIQGLDVEITDLKNKIQYLEDKNEMLVKQLQEMKDNNSTLKGDINQNLARIKNLEKENNVQKAREDDEKSLFTIIQIGSAIQRNMCKYVLREHFKEKYFYKFKGIDEYIRNVKQTNDRLSAKKRLRELKKKIHWDQQLVDSLKNLNQTRIKIAHPDLSSEKIQEATDYLRKKGQLDEELADNINTLKEMWKTSETLLQTSTEEGQDQGGPRNVSTAHAGQKRGAYATKSDRGRDPPKRARKSQTSSSKVKINSCG